MADNTIETELIPRLKDQGVVSKLGMFYVVMTHLLALNVFLLPMDITIIFICYYCSWCCAVWQPKKSPRTSSIVQIIFFF